MDCPKKILMLHGYSQSDVIFRAKTAAMRKQLAKRGYELLYPCGPCKLQSKDFNASEVGLNETQQSGTMYGWFIKNPDTNSFSLNKELLQYLASYIKENGPFHGISGFSQGAGLAGYLSTNINSILSLTETEQPPLEFAIFFSGFKFDPEDLKDQYDKHPIKLPTLHVMGELDTLVTEELSYRLFEVCDKSSRTLLKHSGGHYIPNTKVFINQIVGWMHGHTKASEQPSNTTARVGDQITSQPELDADLLDMIDSLGEI